MASRWVSAVGWGWTLGDIPPTFDWLNIAGVGFGTDVLLLGHYSMPVKSHSVRSDEPPLALFMATFKSLKTWRYSIVRLEWTLRFGFLFFLEIDANKFGCFIFLMLLTDFWFTTSAPSVLTDDLNMRLAFSPPLPVSAHTHTHTWIVFFILFAVKHTRKGFSQDIWVPDIFRKIVTKPPCTSITDILVNMRWSETLLRISNWFDSLW